MMAGVPIAAFRKCQKQQRELAEALLSLAATAGVPDSFWWSDSRIVLAVKTLKLTSEEAQRKFQGEES